MAAVKELIRAEEDGSLSFGDYELKSKSKKDGFEHKGDLYKVKTFDGLTRLECNDGFMYESVPGTAVSNFRESAEGVEFYVEGASDAQITVGLEEEASYSVAVDGSDAGTIMTGLGGKLSLSVELGGRKSVHVQIIRV